MSKSKEAGDKKKSEKKEKRSKKDAKVEQGEKQFSLLADDKTLNSGLASLFAVKQPPVKAKPPQIVPRPSATQKSAPAAEDEADEENDAELSELDEDIEDVEMDDASDVGEEGESEGPVEEATIEEQPKRKRKRKEAGDDLEDAYMSRLAREEEKENDRLAAERAVKRQKQHQADGPAEEGATNSDADEAEEDTEIDVDEDEEDEENAMSPPPKHETELAADEELSKANRTVFLGNVSTAAISSKSSRKTLLSHLASFFEKLPPSKDGKKHKVESIRFRSTPYATAIPKKAAFAKKELMDATTKSTNAYVVYSTEKLAREAVQHLNGTTVLERHLRVDSVAHPAKIDNRRCVFVGNLGFVDDETNIQEANEEDGREKRKRGKEPADIEEGLWRTFSKSGKVESVRVIRDSTTRVGKGIAYVQFEDENAVEQALLLNEKKFPPMLPRKLRVSRAKAPKKNAKPGTGRPSASTRPSAATGYQKKLTGAEASQIGRTGKLLGRAAAAKVHHKKGGSSEAKSAQSKQQFGDGGIKRPEDFIKKSPMMIFEGHRASSKQGKSGLKLGGKKSKSKVTKRSTSFKSKKKASS